MEASNPFTEQARLMIALLPQVAKQTCFALKGGTAINLFIRDMPRLSVDIDLAYLPVEDRQTSLTNIDKTLAAIATAIEQHIAGASVRASFLKGTGKRYKLLVWQGKISVKIEVSPVLRGSVYPAEFEDMTYEPISLERLQKTLKKLEFIFEYAGFWIELLDFYKQDIG